MEGKNKSTEVQYLMGPNDFTSWESLLVLVDRI